MSSSGDKQPFRKQSTTKPPSDPYEFKMQTQSAALNDYSIWTGEGVPPHRLGNEADFYIHRVFDSHGETDYRLYFKSHGQWKRYLQEARSKQEAHAISHPIYTDAILFVGASNVRWVSSWQVYKNVRRQHELNATSEKHLPRRLWIICQGLCERDASAATDPKGKRNAREREKRRRQARWHSGSRAGSSYTGSPKLEEFSDNSAFGSDYEGTPEHESKSSPAFHHASPHFNRHRSSLPTPPPTGERYPSLRKRSATAPTLAGLNQSSGYPTPPSSQPDPRFQPHGQFPMHQQYHEHPSNSQYLSSHHFQPQQQHYPSPLYSYQPSPAHHSNPQYQPNPQYQSHQSHPQHHESIPSAAGSSSNASGSEVPRAGRPWEL